jgi:hypothetical protein
MANDGDTGFGLLPTLTLFPKPENLPPQHQQVFDSFKLLAANSSNSSSLQPSQEEAPPSKLTAPQQQEPSSSPLT